MSAGQRLRGKTILVTGASSGIGRSTALEYARTSPDELKLIVTARRVDVLEELAKEIAQDVGDGVKVLPVQLDITNPAEVTGFVSRLPAEFQDIDILVNNAGIVKGLAQAPNIDPEDIDIMFATNVNGLINMTQEVLPTMLRKGKNGGAGDIVMMGSIAGLQGYPGGSVYCATKAAVRTFTDALRRELIATRIRIIEIHPGQVLTPLAVIRFYGDKEKAAAVYKGVEPLTPEDVAELVVFATSRKENVVTADFTILPNHQASATVMHRKS